MATLQNQKCPLRQRVARFWFVDATNRKHFLCDHCVEFQISLEAEKRLLVSIEEWRTQLSEKAKQSNDTQVLVITLPFGPQQEGSVTPALVGEFVLRTKITQ